MTAKYTKRSFLKTSLAGAVCVAMPATRIEGLPLSTSLAEPPSKYTILFQGDSITDAGRIKESRPKDDLGRGYVYAIASRLGTDFAQSDFTFYNRGISGDKVYQLERRWQKDALDLKPDLLSVLAGINDVGDIINDPGYLSIQPGFEGSFRHILQAGREQNPSLLIVLGLPFFYPIGKRAEKRDLWEKLTKEKQETIRQLAKEFDAILIDYPAMFARIMKNTSMEYWVSDGVHPSMYGHELMAREWLKQVSKKLDFLKIYV